MDILSTVSRRLGQSLTGIVSDARPLALPHLPTSAVAFLAKSVYESSGQNVLCIAHEPALLAELHRDLRLLTPTQMPLYFPAYHVVTEGRKSSQTFSEDYISAGHRLATLSALQESGRPQLIAASVQALMQKLPEPSQLLQATRVLRTGQQFERERLVDDLLAAGYEFCDEVLEQGTACARGGVVDIWPAAAPWPIRVEIAGSDIESIRQFDPADQRSRGKLDTVTIPPPTERGLQTTKRTASFASFLQDGLTVIWMDMVLAEEHAAMFTSTASDETPTLSFKKLVRELSARPKTRIIRAGDETSEFGEFDFSAARHILGITPSALHADAFEETRQAAAKKLSALVDNGYRIVLSCSSKGAANHFFQKSLIERAAVALHDGPLSSGFGSEAEKVLIVSENDLLPAKGVSGLRYSPFGDQQSAAGQSGFRPAEITDLEPEDLVVHADHGIGIYKGINEISMAGQLQEVLSLEYADGMMLHVPVSQAHLLSRYVGLPHHKARLHKLGGRRWNKEKEAACESIMDMAGSLLELQAHRAVQPGHAFAKDKPWQRDFESSFRYQETQDQVKAIMEVKRDMEAPHPMDRLICGDAGYGKTEVAMRAAFKAVMDNRQVAVLVPTTILAQQHFDTFSERMSIYPVKIAMLSRFCSRADRNRVLKEMNEGTVDIIIGTHALLQPNVSFKDLGLVIIDEEQRFGVEHKERLKHMRKLVDVLTMTATPIPRTLYMSMTGAREMSLIQTPPSERRPVKTVVTKNTDSVVRSAINNELHREGQVFYLHNRIITIERVLKRLAGLLPEARIGVAHGRMPAHELSEVMHAFARRELDILLCTTIIESGLDIPTANTILIDRADRFGIADLYQLRGRVGRSTRRAYAYLLLPERGRVDSDARSRIGAVKTYSGLAAGFNLALRDMEIRGVGNILGAAQSGHISAIGFGLYCQLLKRTVDQMKGKRTLAPVSCMLKLDFISFTFASTERAVAAIPYTYIEEEKIRLGIYRKVAEALSPADVKDLRNELADRFGPLAVEAHRLLAVTLLRITASGKGLSGIETREDRLMLMKGGDYIKTGRLFPRLKSKDPDRKLKEILAAVRKLDS